MKKKKFIKSTVVGCVLILLVVGLVGATYMIMDMIEKENNNISDEATFEIEYEDSDTLELTSVKAMNDSDGMENDPFKFKVINTSDKAGAYRIIFENDPSIDSSNIISKENIKISVKEGLSEYTTPVLLSDIGNGMYLINNEILYAGESRDYEIIVWVDEEAININSNKLLAGILKIESVELIDGMYVDSTAPKIELNGESTINLTRGSTLSDPGIKSVTDDYDSLSNGDVIISYMSCTDSVCTDIDNIDVNVVGKYQIHYSATDSYLNTGTTIREINIIEEDTTIE